MKLLTALVEELLVITRLDNVVREIDQELGEAALRSGIVTQDRGEGSIAKGLRKTLAESLTSAGIVA